MTAPSDDRLESAFHAAMNCRTDSAQQQFLVRLRAEDAALAAEVESLLAARTRLDQFFEAPASVTFSGLLRTLQKGTSVQESDMASLLTQLDCREKTEDLGLLRGFSLKECVAVGNTGFVFRAWDSQLNRQVALKVLAASIAADESRRLEFLNEARITSRIRHENVVTIYSVSADDPAGAVFYAMEWVEGTTLQAWSEQHPELSLESVPPMLGQIVNGLSAIHSQGIIHRDLKPGNILLENDTGRIVILDFGLAFEQQTTQDAERLAGTPLYMSPEGLRGEPVSPRSDLFSLGAIAFLLTCKQHPFEGRTIADVMDRILDGAPAFPDSLTDCPEAVRQVLGKCLAAEPAKRYASAGDFFEDFREAFGPSCPADRWSQAFSFTNEGRSVRRRLFSALRRTQVLFGLVLVAILVLVLVEKPRLWPSRPPSGSPQAASSVSPRMGFVDEDIYVNFVGMPFRRIPAVPPNVNWPPFPERRDLTDRVDWRVLDEDRFLGVHEVTRREFAAVMGRPPTEDQGSENDGDTPIVGISFDEAVVFCQKMTERDPDGHWYSIPGETEWTYAAFGYALLSGLVTLDDFERDFLRGGDQVMPVSETPANALGLKGMSGNAWEWIDATIRKQPVWNGVVSYADFGETPAEESRLLVGGGARDLFLHAFDMNSGMNDFLEVAENSRPHTEPDDITKYLYPTELNKPMRLVYRYALPSPIRAATLKTTMHLHVANATCRVRIQAQPSGSLIGIDSDGWTTIFSCQGIDTTPPDEFDISDLVRGATDVRVEYQMEASEPPLHYTQFARTAGPNGQFPNVGRFAADLEPVTDTPRKRVVVPRSYRHAVVGLRVAMGVPDHLRRVRPGHSRAPDNTNPTRERGPHSTDASARANAPPTRSVSEGERSPNPPTRSVSEGERSPGL